MLWRLYLHNPKKPLTVFRSFANVFAISPYFLKFRLILIRIQGIASILEKYIMKKMIPVFFSFALALAFTQPALAGDEKPCKFMQLEPDRRGWARFQCPDCTVVSVKQGPWSQRHVAKSVCAQVGPGASARAIVPNNRKQN